MSAVRSDWEKGRGDVHLQRSGEHFNIYSDLYKRVFRPLGFLGVTYGNTDIRRGNIVHPIKVNIQNKGDWPNNNVKFCAFRGGKISEAGTL